MRTAATATIGDVPDLTDPQVRRAWLEWRRDGIGASEVAATVALSPWVSRWSLWANKVGLDPDDEAEVSEAMEWGLYAERSIGPWFEARTGATLTAAQLKCVHPTEAWMRCTLDSAGTLEDEAIGVEMKATTASPKEWEEAIPDHYACQAAWQMAVTGYPRIWFAVLHTGWGGVRFRTYLFERDEADIRYLTNEAGRFWHTYVVPRVPPPVDSHPATTDALKRVWRPPAARTEVNLTKAQADVVAALKDCKAKQATLGVRREHLENQVREILADRTDGLVNGHLAVSWRPSTRTSHDDKALHARLATPDRRVTCVLPPLDLDAYRRQSEVRRLLTHNPSK